MKHRAIGIIPARGGSKRIPYKNIIELNGQPLIVYSIIVAKDSKFLKDNIIVSTEDTKIEKVTKISGAKVIKRPSNLATDDVSTLDVLKHSVEQLEKSGEDFDTVVLLQPTTPFRTAFTIDKGIKKLWDCWDSLDAVFTVRQTKFPPEWLLTTKGNILEFLLPNDFSKIRSQDLKKTYEIDGVLYVFKKKVIKKADKYPFVRDRTGYIITDKIESIDIDDEFDLEIARAIASAKQVKL